MIKKTSQQWYAEIPRELGFVIYDPDGWDRKNYEFSFNQELITKEEFIKRTFGSTVLSNKNAHEFFTKWETENPAPKKRWFISDTHFNDSRFNVFYRPFATLEEQHETITNNWNKLIQPDDEVYHIGDVAIDDDGLKFMDQLNGYKILITGNYDDPRDKKLLQSKFNQIHNSLVINIDDKPVHLVHYPVKGLSNMFNIVGHIHGLWKVQRNMINVGVDAWNYLPVSEEQVKFCMNAIDKFYDDNVFAGSLQSNFPTKVIYSTEEIKTEGPTVFLAGPTPRTAQTPSWRPEFIKELFTAGFRGTILTPEIRVFEDGYDYDKQVDWENEGLNAADLIVFWVPRELKDMPGFTTNIEFGEWMKSGKVVLGYPQGAAKMNYLHYKAGKHGIPVFHTIPATCDSIIEKLTK
jgi:calcineurin-like phosphoesterase family protein